MKKCVLIYSGGMDSFTLMHDLMSHQNPHHGWLVSAISFDYGQRHKKELVYATAECARIGMPHKVVDLSSINTLMDGCSLTRAIPIPEGHYQEDSMKQTVVPNRNMIMLSCAVAYAVSIKADAVYFGAHAGDHAIYPDCREGFIAALSRVTEIANYHPVNILAPYINKTKGQIAVIGKKLGLDYGRAWTCYNGRDKACGKCGACQERIEAMAFAGITDGMEYEV